MKTRTIVKVIATLAIPVVASTGATADVVCNEDGDCWKVKEKYEYRPELRLRIYSDDWKWADHEKDKYRWREAGKGRGYWSKGVWIEF
jgi:hypothetical protein